MTAETLAAIWEAIITTYDEFAIGFSLEPEKVKDRSVDLELPRAFWAMPRVTVQWVAGTGAYDQTFEVNILFLGQTASDRTADTATGTHSDMAIAAQRCLERFIDLYVNGDTLFMGEVVNIERIGAGTLSPLIDEDTTQLTGVNLRIDVTVRAAECAAGYFDGIPSETADCDAATVTNSDDSYTRTVAPGATLELPDVTHTDSDGSPVTLPGMVAFVATPCAPGDDAHVLINQNPVIDLGPGETWDLHVEYPDGTPVGSWNAGAERWEIPECPACDPATAVLKNTDGTILDTEEIPSGGSEDIIAPDATAVLKNSAGTTLDTELIPSGVSENIVVADTTIQRKTESGVDIGVTIALPSGTGPHTVTCPNADVTVNNTSFTDVESGSMVDVVVANTDGTKVGSENAVVWEVPDATAVLKNSAGTTLDTELIPSGVSEDVIAPDATVQLKDSAGTNIGTPVAVPSGVSQNITAPDGTVRTTDGLTTVAAVKSNGTADLPQSVVKYKDAANADQVTAASNTEYSGGTLRPATQIPRRELTRDGVGTGSYVTAADLIAGTVPDVTTERAIVASWAAGDDETIPIILPAEYQGQTFDYVSNTGTNGTITVSVDGASSYAAPPFTVGTLGVSFKRTTYAAAGSVLYEV